MAGTYIDPYPKKTKALIDPDGNILESLDNKQIIKRNDPDPTPPANLGEILAVKEERLKTIPEDQLGQFNLSNSTVETGKPASELSLKEIQAQIEELEKRLVDLKNEKKQKIEEMKKQLAELEE